MHIIILFTFMMLITLGGSDLVWALQETPQTFTFDGRAYSNSAATTPMLDTISTKIQILNPTQDCILYEETQSVNTTSSNGYFTLQVGSATGSGKRSAGDSNNAMSSVFSNRVASLSGKLVSNGAACTYTPTIGDKRYVRMQMTPAGDGVTRTISPNVAIDSVPGSLVAERAETLQGYAPSSFLQTNVLGSNVLSQANLESIFTTTSFPRLTSLLSVPVSNYVQTGTNGSALIPSVAGNPGSGLAVGQIWYDSTANQLKFYDGGVKTVGSGGGTPGGSSGQIQFNSSSAFAGDSNLAWDNTAKRLGVGISTPAASLEVAGDVKVGNSSATCSNATKGSIRYNNATSVLEFCNGTSWNLVQAASCTDATPTVFSFTNEANATTSTLYLSNVIQITGIDCSVPVSISGQGTPQFRICSDNACATVVQGWTGSPAAIVNNQYLQVRLTTDVAGGATFQATVTIGSGATVWSVTNAGGDCTLSPAPGTVCSDGTIYAGLSPDGNVKMFTTRCDFGQTWDGTSCTGVRTTVSFNKGVPLNFTVGTGSGTTGKANSALLAAAGDAGAPYSAAIACESLVENGYSDWYLPAAAEMAVVYNNSAAIRNFAPWAIEYWTTTEYSGTSVYGFRMSTGASYSTSKETLTILRCVRR